MSSSLDKVLTFQEMEALGYICEDLGDFLNALENETGNEIEVCGMTNLKAPDPRIYMKHRMDFDWVTGYIDNCSNLKDDRIRAGKLNRVYCVKHFSAEVLYDWKSKNDA